MAGLEECEGKLLLTLYRLKRMKEENPRIRKELEVLEKNVEDKLLQLGWTMEQDEVADCANKEEEAVIAENVADVTPLQCSCIMSLHKTAMPHVSNLMSMTKLPM